MCYYQLNMKQIFFNFYKKWRLVPDPDTFTILLIVSLMSLGLGIYNNYQISNGVSVNNNVVNGKKVLPLKDLVKNIDKASQTMGNADAKVVLVAFEDFQCPYCKKFHDDTFPQLKKEYIDTGKVLFIHQDLSFLGIESNSAAEAAQCAGDQGKFWEYRDELYKNQVQTHNAGNFSDENLGKLARNIDINMVQFSECYDGRKYKDLVSKTTVFADKYGISSTPTFVVNGVMIKGARPYDSFKSVIDNLLK